MTGERQTQMFSATFPEEIQKLAADFMTDYLFLAIGRVGSSTDLITQHLEEVEGNEKRTVLLSLINAVEVRGSPCCYLPSMAVSTAAVYIQSNEETLPVRGTCQCGR